MNVSRNTHAKGSDPPLKHMNTPPAESSSAVGMQGSVERQSMNESKLNYSNRGRFRPSFGHFSSNWSSSGSEGGRGRGSFFGRNTVSES